MKSALGLILGISLLASGVGCGTSDPAPASGPVVVTNGGTTGTGAGGTGTVVPTGGTATGVATEGVPLSPMNGWVDKASNTLGIQGAMFPFGDDTSKMGMVPTDFSMSGANACLKGTAAKVDLKCTPVAPATDCYGTFWGAAIGLNLNQPIDMTTMMGTDPQPFDASGLKGFSFEISGNMVPLPKDLRFKVEDATGEYCTSAKKQVASGPNTFLFSELFKECWKADASVTAEGAKSGLLKISWQVVTNSTSTVAFDFCVSNVRAIPN